jgi:hypothetical protein
MKLSLVATFLVVLVTAVTVAPALGSGGRGLPSAPTSLPKPSPCSPVQEIPGLGTACPLDHGFLIPLSDGSTVYTHGPDPMPDALFAAPGSPQTIDDVLERLGAPKDRSLAQCVPHAADHGLLVYAHAANTLDRWEAVTPLIHAHFQAASAVLALQSHVSNFYVGFGLRWVADQSITYRYRMECAGQLDGGVPWVQLITLPTPAAATTFSTIVNDMKAMGYNDAHTKYWVWYDGFVNCGCSGTGTIWNDNSPSPSTNQNNRGPSYGVTFAGNSILIPTLTAYTTMMHENGHNLGAVQLAAPHTSGAWHCNDGLDIMCYADGGPASNYNDAVCAGWEHYDCNSDDYFVPFPVSLETGWNIGQSNWFEMTTL